MPAPYILVDLSTVLITRVYTTVFVSNIEMVMFFMSSVKRRTNSLRLPGIVLGLGLGGFVDGILLHQVLQWHHMLSSRTAPTTVAGLEVNTLWDGLFHASTWVFVVIGLALLWHAVARVGALPSSSALLGWTLAGWGVFNLVEGTISHHILQIHHVRPGPNQLEYDLGFLVLGALLLVCGRTLAIGGERNTTVGQ